MNEYRRKLFHAVFGAAIALGTLALGRTDGLSALLLMLVVGLALIHWKLAGNEGAFIDYFLERMERRVPVPGMGALMFVVGAILALSFSKSTSYAVACLLALSFGDAASTMVGIAGKNKIQFNSSKTWEGYAAFLMAASATTLPLLGTRALFFSAVLACIEVLPLPLDDNLAIPVAGAALSFVI